MKLGGRDKLPSTATLICDVTEVIPQNLRTRPQLSCFENCLIEVCFLDCLPSRQLDPPPPFLVLDIYVLKPRDEPVPYEGSAMIATSPSVVLSSASLRCVNGRLVFQFFAFSPRLSPEDMQEPTHLPLPGSPDYLLTTYVLASGNMKQPMSKVTVSSN